MCKDKMRRILLIVMLLFCTAAQAVTVEGDGRYKLQVEKCLELLSMKAANEYTLVEGFVGIISQSDKSGMNAWEDPPRYLMSDRTAFYSVTWCAGTIAHDAYHSFLYKKYMPADGSRTPYEKWGGFDAERKAINFQEKVMKKIGASKHELNYLKSLDGKHGDVNKDGKLNREDYEQRSW